MGKHTCIVSLLVGLLPTVAMAEDWATRSSKPEVLMATKFDTAAEVTDWRVANGAADHVTWDQTMSASPGGGSLRFAILKTDAASSGDWSRWLSDDQREFGEGDEFYVQYRQYVPTFLATHDFAGGGGWKQSIISRHSAAMGPAPYGSNQLNEIVLQNTNHRGIVQGYNRDLDGKFPPWEVPAVTACSNSDFRYQNAIDRGPQSIGTPCQNDRARYGGLYSYYQSNPSGAPDPLTGAFIYYPNEWVTYLFRVRIGTYGSNNHLVQVWGVRQGDTQYTLIHDKQNLRLGQGPPHDALWLLPYNTNRVADAGRQDTFTAYDEVIVSLAPIAAPNGSVPLAPRPPTNLSTQ
jgi:hypothetical protein